MKAVWIALIAVITIMTSPGQAADDWPSRPVRVVSSFAAGGAADMLARTVAEHLSTVFKQQFFVEVRAGAGGSIAVHTVANSPPDGYNLVLSNVSHLVLLPMTSPNYGLNPRRDLSNIAYVAGSPIVLSVNPKSGIQTIQDFVSLGKTTDRPLTYSSSGLGTTGHFVGELFVQKSGIRAEHVPYKGGSQGVADLVAGHIMWSSQTVTSTSSHLLGGTLRGLAVTSEERLPDYSDIPTFKESGFPDLVATIWFSISGPAAMPLPIVEKLNRAIIDAMHQPKVIERLRREGSIVQPMSVDQFRQFIDNEIIRWKPVVESSGLVGKQ
jgi:tripartite-type tricarboxylate transporter receptor subunit TctC